MNTITKLDFEKNGKKYKMHSANLVDISEEIIVPDGVTYGRFHFYKMGNLVLFTIHTDAMTFTNKTDYDNDTLLFTIPDEYLPPVSYTFPCTIASGNSTYGYGALAIKDGTCRYSFGPNTSTKSYLFCSGFWMIGNPNAVTET